MYGEYIEPQFFRFMENDHIVKCSARRVSQAAFRLLFTPESCTTLQDYGCEQ